MIQYNLHQHSLYSDGAAEPEAYVQQALNLGFKAMGFSEHSPLPFSTTFSLKEEKVEDYIRETERLKEKYGEQINLYRALEMDFIPGFSENFALWREKAKLDYAIGSVHMVHPESDAGLWFIDGPERNTYDDGLQKFFGGDIKKAVKAYFYQVNRMIESQDFEIIGHMDKIKMHNQNRYFTEDELWYRNLIDETIRLIREKNLIVEVNTRGLYKKRSDRLFPDDYALRRVLELNIPIVISSDAHKPEELNLLFESTEKHLFEMGFKAVAGFEKGTWKEISLG
ncbi:MAG: histidinol-phosphatase [Bacteroidales bacterium]|nr:histidinol-phosphatase [Bacteroidales bacterium]